jgi:HEAT repeat protein
MPRNQLMVVPDLVPMLKDKDSDIRWSAAAALGGFGPEAKAAVPALIEVLKDKSQYLPGAAAVALEKINTSEARQALEQYREFI